MTVINFIYVVHEYGTYTYAMLLLECREREIFREKKLYQMKKKRKIGLDAVAIAWRLRGLWSNPLLDGLGSRICHDTKAKDNQKYIASFRKRGGCASPIVKERL